MRLYLLLIGLVVGLLSPVARAQNTPCGISDCPVVGDLKRVTGGADVGGAGQALSHWSMPTLPDYSELSDAELASAAVRLEQQAAALGPYTDAYAQLMDRVAGANFTIWARLTDATARARADPYGTGLRFPGMLVNWEKNLSYDQKKLLEAALNELIRQMRQDLRTGQTSAPFDPGDIGHETTPEGIVAAMRLNQLLQEGRLPTDFEAHSPTSVADVRGLQALDEGVFPDVKTQRAAFQSVLFATRDAADGRFMEYAERGQVPPGSKGLDETLPNGERIAEVLDQLVRQQWALNETLKARGGAPAETPTLDAVVGRVAQLDSDIGKFGKAFVDQLNGRYSFTMEHLIVYVGDEPELQELPRELYRPAPVAGPGARGYESHNLDGRLTFFKGSDFSPSTPLSDAERDELVRVKDSAELLAGNTTGLSVAHIQMSEGLRSRLGLGGEYRPPALPESLTNSNLPAFFRPRQRVRDRPALIDLAALLPVEERGKWLLDLGGKAFERSLDQRSDTELTAEFDNTWLNRTVEVLDVPGWIFKGDNPDNWIGPRAERNLWRSKRWGEMVDERSDAAAEDSIYGRYSPAMGALREIHDINNQHERLNVRYAEQHRETEFATMMYVGMLPLSAFGLAETGVALARPVVARLGMRTTVSLADDVARSADDLARLADDALTITDDVARGADDLARLVDDGPPLKIVVHDEFAEGSFDIRARHYDLSEVVKKVRGAGDDLAGAGDDLARAADEVAEGADELVSAGDGIHYNGKVRDKLYVNRSNTQQLHVDLANDPKLKEAMDTAIARISKGQTVDEKLAHLVDHVHSDVTYDMAAQQAKYIDDNLLPSGQAQLGDMLQDGAVVCREKAIFTHELLSELGIESKVVIGNVTAHDGVYGHAWVQLTDGTVVDGTWGRIFVGGKGYPVESVLKTQVFSSPNTLISGAQVDRAVANAAKALETPKQLQALQRDVLGRELTSVEKLLTVGSDVKVPQKKGGLAGLFGGKKSGKITRVEREMVFVQVDETELMFPQGQILDLNNVKVTPPPQTTRPRPSWKGR